MLEALYASSQRTISFGGISDLCPFMDLQNRLHLLLRSHISPQIWMGRMSNNHWMPKNWSLGHVINVNANVYFLYTHEETLKAVLEHHVQQHVLCVHCDRIRPQQLLSVYVSRPTSDKCLLSCWTYSTKKRTGQVQVNLSIFGLRDLFTKKL